jgi:hypothetical protein
VFITLPTNGTPSGGTIKLTGSTTSADTTITGTYATSGGPCNNDAGTFTITHP